MEQYTLGACIGRGSYGDVYKGVETASGKEVAFKIIDLEEVEDDIESIHKEISMLAGCQCKNITQYHTAILRPGTTELMIVMELMACSVADLLAHGPLDEETIAYVLHEVIGALVYLHTEKRIHRDVKAANVLLSTSGDVKISDFGVSGQLTGTMGFRRRTFVGTPFWMAPEVIESSEEGYSERADIWSLGITAIEMATGSPPHAELHPMRVLFLIPKSQPPQLEGNFTDTFRDFVNKCLQKDPAQRPSAMELLLHPFVKDAIEAPPSLGGMAAEFAKRRQPLKSRKDMAEDWGPANGTLPGWDFGTRKIGGRLTIQMSDTNKATVQDRLGPGSKVDYAIVNNTGTITSRPSLPRPAQTSDAAVSEGPLAALSAAGTLPSGQQAGMESGQGMGTARGSVSLGGAPLQPAAQQQGTMREKSASTPLLAAVQGTGTLQFNPSGGGHRGDTGPAAARYPVQQPSSSVESSGDTYATVKVAGIDPNNMFGTVQSKVTPLTAASQAAATAGSAETTPGASQLRRTNTLQVQITDPATASPETGQELHAHAMTRIAAGTPTHSRPMLQVAESNAVLAHVLLPALDTICACASQNLGGTAQQQAVAGLRAHIQQVERQCPGTSVQLLQEILAQLAASSQPALHPTRAAAAALLAPGPPVHAVDTSQASGSSGTPQQGAQSDYAAALAAAAGNSQPGPSAKRGSKEGIGAGMQRASTTGGPLPMSAGAANQTPLANGHICKANSSGATLGAVNGPAFLPPRQVAALGALGEFLLGKWQLETAREHALLARTGALGTQPPHPKP